MGSSATDKAVKKPVKTKKYSGKKKVTKKAAKPRATTVKKKKATSRKKAVTTKKAAAKKKTVKKKAPRKKAATKAAGKSVSTAKQHADASPPTPATPDHSSAQDGSRSLSWMAAQAASALKAVKANQNERAQVLMAKAEITPAAPAKPSKKVSPPVEADVSKALTDTAPEKPLEPATKKQKASAKPAKPAKKEDARKALTDNQPATQKEARPDTPPKPGKAVTEKTVKEAPAVKISPAKSAALAPESSRPGSATPKTVKVPTVPATAAQPEPTVNTEQKQTSSPPAHVIANTATSGSKRSIRPILLTAIIILLGILGTRTWLGGDDTTAIATLQDSATTEQPSPAAAQPQHDSTSVVTIKTAVKPATSATETDHWSPTTNPEWPEPSGSKEPVQTVNTATPAADEIVVTETRQVQTTPQTTRPAAPQPGYYAPGYGYGYGYGNYQRQPLRQQPYYQPAYARPSYSQ